MFSKYFLPAICVVAVAHLSAAPSADIPGVHNFHQVDVHVYRGAQPTDQGYQSLAKLGVKTIVDLQAADTRAWSEAQAVKAAGMQYINVPMQGMATPADSSVDKVLGLLEDSATGPVFVHCHRGADRTGAVIACYRIEHDHWQNDRALSEARSLGMSWYQKALQNYVRRFEPRAASSGTTALASSETPSTPILAPAFAR